MFTKTASAGRAFLALCMAAGIVCQAGPAGKQSSSQTAATGGQQTAPEACAAAAAAAPGSAAVPDSGENAAKTVTVYYFHTSLRCHTCTLMEALTKEAVEEDFAREVKSGRVVFKAVNVEEKGNEHFVERYRLHTKSVIVSVSSGDSEKSWKNLDQIWMKVRGTPEEFKRYIRSGVRDVLG